MSNYKLLEIKLGPSKWGLAHKESFTFLSDTKFRGWRRKKIRLQTIFVVYFIKSLNCTFKCIYFGLYTMLSYDDSISHCESKNAQLIATPNSRNLPWAFIKDLYTTGLDLIWINITTDAIEEIVDCLGRFWELFFLIEPCFSTKYSKHGKRGQWLWKSAWSYLTKKSTFRQGWGSKF